MSALESRPPRAGPMLVGKHRTANCQSLTEHEVHPLPSDGEVGDIDLWAIRYSKSEDERPSSNPFWC
jgi:hypothetical protein